MKWEETYRPETTQEYLGRKIRRSETFKNQVSIWYYSRSSLRGNLTNGYPLFELIPRVHNANKKSQRVPSIKPFFSSYAQFTSFLTYH